ncbi:NAD(P)H-dependent FMN reductase [Allocatelliglobosispora scoriae]|uniref:NAD(P)H-dependent FMN reductase n=1 Tax=Allocatelliglobosispora scoriae TaxID=643052 RepID=A0A841BRG0_9ACTN|nr:NAD(P)H-dependent oxidoreductase [Allocatelliglobosispora scoriae]MBB5870824.1 NAD(P)H-dependent FMN reductase [Allocatelliglobosispora scoriae]
MTDRPLRILIVGASLRTGSYNVALARLAARRVGETGAEADLVPYAELAVPDYDADAERADGVPPAALAFRDRLRAADALIIAAPEYNHSIPGSLKNLIDWTSRIKPQPFWGGNGMLLSASPSLVGGNRGAWALRVPLEHLGMRVYPEMFSLAQAGQALTPEGEFVDSKLAGRFDTAIEGFLELVEATVRYADLKRRTSG